MQWTWKLLELFTFRSWWLNICMLEMSRTVSQLMQQLLNHPASQATAEPWAVACEQLCQQWSVGWEGEVHGEVPQVHRHASDT